MSVPLQTCRYCDGEVPDLSEHECEEMKIHQECETCTCKRIDLKSIPLTKLLDKMMSFSRFATLILNEEEFADLFKEIERKAQIFEEETELIKKQVASPFFQVPGKISKAGIVDGKMIIEFEEEDRE